MKTWKKIAVVAVTLLALASATFVGMMIQKHHEKPHKDSYMESFWVTPPQYVSKHILMEHGYHGQRSYVQLKDMRTGRFTTPKLNHIFINGYDSEDSLVVFRTQDRLRGYLNVNTGQIIIPAQYNRAWNFSEGIAGVLKDGEVIFIKENGERAFDRTFPICYYDDYNEIAFQFHHGLCVMRTMENKWGLINTQGEWIVEPVYTTISAPQYGYRIVCDGEKYGLLTLDGQTALPLEYDYIRLSHHYDGFTIAKNGYAKVIGPDLQTIVPFVYDGLYTLNDVDDDRTNETPMYWRYDVGEGSGVIDLEGHVIIPAVYYMVRMVDDDHFDIEVTCGGDHILLNNKGQVIGKSHF